MRLLESAGTLEERASKIVTTGKVPGFKSLGWTSTYRLRTRKPLWHKGFRRERATGLEPATSSLGSWHSTTELRPRMRKAGGAEARAGE